MSARIAAFVVWAAVAACLAFWGLRLFVTPRAVPVQAQPVSMAGAQRGEMLRLFAAAPQPTAGAVPSEPALAARFKLVGVMAPRNAEKGREQGVALIAVDDKPPRAYRVGARVDNSMVLQSVASRSAVIGPARGAAAVQLDLPLPPAPATGTLPPPADGFITAQPMTATPVAPAVALPASPVPPAANLAAPKPAPAAPPTSAAPVAPPAAPQVQVQPSEPGSVPAYDPANQR